MNLDELIKKVDTSKTRVLEILKDLNITETEFTEDHVKIFHEIRAFRENCSGNEHERTEQAIKQYLAKSSALTEVKSQAVTVPEDINPDLLELMEGLAQEIARERNEGNLEEYIEGAVSKAYESKDVNNKELGAKHMEVLINKETAALLNSPVFTARATELFESAKKRISQNRK
jgi:hypothetical protein